jgi:hypothetical protein
LHLPINQSGPYQMSLMIKVLLQKDHVKSILCT